MVLNLISEGAEVVDANGERLGSVIAAAPDYIVAEKGFFFPTDFYIPLAAIAEVSDATVRLNVTKAEALDHGWGVTSGEEASPITASPETQGN